MPLQKPKLKDMGGYLHSRTAHDSAHYGQWMILPESLNHFISSFKKGLFEPKADADIKAFTSASGKRIVDANGIAVIEIKGILMKGESWFGTSTIAIRHAIRAAASSPDVTGILLYIDSPGGTVAGTGELARDIKEAAAVKPVYAHVDDCAASAAYWAASQASKVYANDTAQVGCIGTIYVIEDWSKALEEAGVKVHVIATGDYKGAGQFGTEVTPEHLEYFQGKANSLNRFFLDAVKSGRGMSANEVRAVSDGRSFVANNAKDLGLIDKVQSLDDSYAALAKAAGGRKSGNNVRQASTRLARAKGK